jgi:hypothetical protein
LNDNESCKAHGIERAGSMASAKAARGTPNAIPSWLIRHNGCASPATPSSRGVKKTNPGARLSRYGLAQSLWALYRVSS